MESLVDLVLELPAPDGGCREAWRIARSDAAIAADWAKVFADFRAMSGAHGMALSDAEVRERCWAPMAAKLAALMATCDGGPGTATTRFAELAMTFLATLAFPSPHPGETLTVAFDAEGDVTIERSPHRLLHCHHVTLGNHRKAMAAMAAAMTQGA